MVDSSYGTGPSNSNQSKYQVSGLTATETLSGISFSTFYSSVDTGQNISGIFVANVPTSESSWNV